MKQQVRVALVVAAAGMVALTGCGGGGEPDTAPSSPTGATSSAPTSAAPSSPANTAEPEPEATTDATTSVETSPPVAQEKGGVRMLSARDCSALGGTLETLGEDGGHVQCADGSFTVYTTQDQEPLSADPGTLPKGWKRIKAPGWTYGIVATADGGSAAPQFMLQDRSGTVLACTSPGSTSAALAFCDRVRARLTT